MKFKFLSLFIALTLVLGLVSVQPVQAAGYGTSFVTSITYMNVGSGPASIMLEFFVEGATTPTQTHNVATLPAGAAASSTC